MYEELKTNVLIIWKPVKISVAGFYVMGTMLVKKLFRSNRSQDFFKIGVLKSNANLTACVVLSF